MKHQPVNLTNIYTLITLTLLLAIGTSGFAQKTILTGGDDATGSGGSVSFSIGQPFYEGTEHSSGTVYQGVQQPHELFDIVVEEGVYKAFASSNLQVYPNPSTRFITLDQEEAGNYQKLQWMLNNSVGMLVKTGRLQGNQTNIELSELNPGIYFLTVFDQDKMVRKFKILKQ